MRDLVNPRWIIAKAALFLVLGLMAIVELCVEQPSLKTAVFLTLGIWSFCRLYYFAFYVVEHYLDSDYRFSGLLSLTRYLARRQKNARGCKSREKE